MTVLGTLYPSRLTAEELILDGIRGMRLTWKMNKYDKKGLVIHMKVQEELDEFSPSERYPFTYQYQESTAERNYPIIKIVAAPGVSIKMNRVPDPFFETKIGIPDVDILRTQDPQAVPPMAADIASYDYCTSEEINKPISRWPTYIGDILVIPPINYIQIERFPNKIIFHHLYSEQALTLTVPQFDQTKSTNDALARFAYEINPDVSGNDFEVDTSKPLIKIAKTKNVKVEIVDEKRDIPGMPPRTPRLYFYVPWVVWNVGSNINDVPPQGSPIDPRPYWQNALLREIPSRFSWEGIKLAIDVVISSIPIIGDIVDIGEFALGLIIGRDKWGRKLDTMDLVLMGVGALLPFVGGAALRAGRKTTQALGRTFSRKAVDAQRLVSELEKAGMTLKDREIIENMIKLVKEGRNPTKEMYDAFHEVLKRTRGEYPSAAHFLNAGETGFVHPQLQAFYQEYSLRQLSQGKKVAGPLEWTRRVTTGRAREILVRLLGKDYAKTFSKDGKKVGRLLDVNLNDIARPPTLTDKRISNAIKQLFRNEKKLAERLGPMIKESEKWTALERLSFALRANAGHMRILKGNIAEIFSMPRQLDVLKRLQERFPKSPLRLISGVRMRLWDKSRRKFSKALLFSDNIIAVGSGNNLKIFAVFEVKSGFIGELEAQGQVFKWIEMRLTDGSQLVVPRGALTMTKDGLIKPVSKELKFTYKPTTSARKKKIPEVFLLASADRHLITAPGVSHVGIDVAGEIAEQIAMKGGGRSAQQIAARVEPHKLGYTSAELDYITALCMQLLRR